MNNLRVELGMATSAVHSASSSPRSGASSQYERFQERMNLDNLLKEASLDRGALLAFLKQNPVAIKDLDAAKIRSIVQQTQATTAKRNSNHKHSHKQATHTISIDQMIQEHEQEEEEEKHSMVKVVPASSSSSSSAELSVPPPPSSHYRIINEELAQLRQSMQNLQRKIRLQTYLSDLKQKKQHNARRSELQRLSQRKQAMIVECQRMQESYEAEKCSLERHMQGLQGMMEHEGDAQQTLLLKKIALQENVSQSKEKLQHLLVEKTRFAGMKDLSQFSPISIFYVLKYLEIEDFINCILCCRAWYFSLNKPCYWRILQRNIIHQSKAVVHEHIRLKKHSHDHAQELVSSESKLKRINHAVMKLKIEPSKEKKSKLKEKKGKSSWAQLLPPRPDDIYQQCMQQLQKVIAQSEQDRDELVERVKAQMSILRFMQASMFSKMHELGELRVRRWELTERGTNEYRAQKRRLAGTMRELEQELQQQEAVTQNMKDEMARQHEIREKKLKIQSDLKSVKSGTSHIQRSNELKKLRSTTRTLASVIVKLRAEIPKRKQEVNKYKDRVALLQSQYQQYTHQGNAALP